MNSPLRFATAIALTSTVCARAGTFRSSGSGCPEFAPFTGSVSHMEVGVGAEAVAAG